jgi:hypothetical protein
LYKLAAQACTLPDRQYVYQPIPLVSRGTVSVGYSYSLLDCVPEGNRSWSMSVDVERVPSAKTEWQVSVEQVQRLSEARQGYEQVLDIVTADPSTAITSSCVRCAVHAVASWPPCAVTGFSIGADSRGAETADPTNGSSVVAMMAQMRATARGLVTMNDHHTQ